jgi:predicted dehydrogenase
MQTPKMTTVTRPTDAQYRRARRSRKPRSAAVEPIGAAVIGYGYWGPNLARNIFERPEFDLRMLCDRDAAQRAAFERRYLAPACEELDEVLDDPTVHAVVIATPPRTHYAIAKAALQAGKHVLVEKPLATNIEDALELAEIASAAGLVLMPGHTFMYSPAVNAIRELIVGGDVGDIHFVTSSRMNLGKYQPDGVVCDLAPHDLSILLHWIDQPVLEVACGGRSVFKDDVPETAFVTLGFAGGATANLQMSWLAPRKVRQMIVVGSKLMVVYDDTAADEQVRVYDRGMDHVPPTNFGEHQLTYRTGDVVIPRIAPAEPLSLEFQDFARAIRTGQQPRSNVEVGLEVVKILEAAEASLRERGVPRTLTPVADSVSAVADRVTVA